MKQLLIYIIDDHELFSLGLKVLIEDLWTTTAVVKTFQTFDELFESIKTEVPDLLIADQILNEGTGLETIMGVKAIHKSIKSILISSIQENRIKELCLQNRIQGYIYKSDLPKNIKFAITKIMNGGTYFSELSSPESKIEIKTYAKINPFSKLTQREIELITFLSQGFEQVEIAKKMNVSVKTIKSHRSHITEKIGKMSLSHLILKANIWGVVKGHNLYSNLEEKDNELT